MALKVMKVFHKELKPKTIMYRSYHLFSNEGFIVDIPKKFFLVDFPRFLLVKLFNDSGMFHKESTVTLIEKKTSPKKAKTK